MTTNQGKFIEYPDFREEWAQLGWYWRWTFDAFQVSDFYMSGRFKWSSAYRSADLSGCGFVFAEQDNGDHCRILRGNVGLALLSGTNKDFGTRCEITNLHLWIPIE